MHYIKQLTKDIKMKLLVLLLLLLTSCGMKHDHQGIPEVPKQVDVDVSVTHSIDFDGITTFCELQDVHTQDCIDSLTKIFMHILRQDAINFSEQGKL